MISVKKWEANNYKASDLGFKHTSDIGAYSEMIVCCDLLRRGFSVFRSISPGAVFDLVVLSKNGTLVSVEVKTASMRNGRTILSNKKKSKAKITAHVLRKDVLYSSNDIGL